MTEHITHVAFDMHQDSITAAWLRPGATTPEVRKIPNEAKPLRRLVGQGLKAGPPPARLQARPVGLRPPAEENARELVRCREVAGEDALRAQHRLRKFLLRHGLRCPAGRAGSQAWWRWVQALRLSDPPAQRTLDEYLLAATTGRARWKALDPEVAALAAGEPWGRPAGWLRCFRGLDTPP